MVGIRGEFQEPAFELSKGREIFENLVRVGVECEFSEFESPGSYWNKSKAPRSEFMDELN